MNMRHLLPFLILPVVACKSPSGYESQANTAQSFHDLHQVVADTRVEMTHALENLRMVQKEAAVDPRPAFEAFLVNVQHLEASAGSMQGAVGSIEREGEEHFAAWEKRTEAITSEKLRERSLERRAVKRQEWLDIVDGANTYLADYGGFVEELRDLATYLESDLNPTGIATVADEIGGVEGHVRDEFVRMHDLMELLVDKAESFGPLPPAEPEPEPAPASEEETAADPE